MKRGTAAKVILGKDTLMDVPAGIVHGTDVILGGKAGLLNDFGGLVLSNNLMIGKKVSRGTITTVTVRGVAPIILPDAIAGSLQAVKAFGGTEQNGTPTPDTPVDIVSNNGVLKYGAIGKNLLNLDASGVIYGDFISDRGTVVHDNTSTISDFIPCTEGAYYTAQVVAWASGSNLRIHGYDENKNWVQMLTKSPASVGVITTATCQIPAEIKYIKVCGYMTGSVGEDAMLEFGSTATPYEPYIAGIYADGTVETMEDTIGNTATAEMLLKVGDYQDEQEILSGAVTRKVGIKAFDGTENWVANTVSSGRLVFYVTKVSIGSDSTVLPNGSSNIKCSHFETSTAAAQSLYGTVWAGGTAINFTAGDFCTDLAAWKQWLADQYAAGTPVIIIYPLATPTTESVAGQHLQVTGGDNVLEITQASLDGLELEATYKSLVQLTIQEVEDANLNNNVEVIIS